MSAPASRRRFRRCARGPLTRDEFERRYDAIPA